jgi:hypothetical protein
MLFVRGVGRSVSEDVVWKAVSIGRNRLVEWYFRRFRFARLSWRPRGRESLEPDKTCHYLPFGATKGRGSVC